MKEDVSLKSLLDKGVALAARQVELCSHSLGRLRAKLDTLDVKPRSASVKVEHSHNFDLPIPLIYTVSVRYRLAWQGHEVHKWKRNGAFLPAIEELIFCFEKDQEFDVLLKMFGEFAYDPRYVVDIVLFEMDDYIVALSIDLCPMYMNAAYQIDCVSCFLGTLADELREAFNFEADYSALGKTSIVLMNTFLAPEPKGRFEIQMSSRPNWNRAATLYFEQPQIGWMHLQGVKVEGTGFNIETINAMNSMLYPRFANGQWL